MKPECQVRSYSNRISAGSNPTENPKSHLFHVKVLPRPVWGCNYMSRVSCGETGFPKPPDRSICVTVVLIVTIDLVIPLYAYGVKQRNEFVRHRHTILISQNRVHS